MSEPSRKRVLVTGGAGFIGGHVTTALLDAGHDVRVLDCVLPAAWQGATPEVDARAEFVIGDVTDPAMVKAMLVDVDVVCHHAAMVGMGVDVMDQPAYVANNVLGTAVLLAAMADLGVGRLVLASSMVVYGEGAYRCSTHGPTRPSPRRTADLEARQFDPRCPRCERPLDWTLVDEGAPLDPRSTYAATKVAQEHLAAAWQRDTSGQVVALRYHNVYGPKMPRNTPYAGVAAIFRSSLEAGRSPEVFEDGKQTRDFVHVDDVARANVLAVVANLREGFTAINVASGRPTTVLAMARALCERLGSRTPVVTHRFRTGDVRHVVASPARARELLGFDAQIEPTIGVRQFADAPLRG